MKAVVLEQSGPAENLIYRDWPDLEPAQQEVVVRLKAAALNHRDLSVRSNPTVPVPVILGSDGAGIVEKKGDEVRGWEIGDEVLINSALGWNEGEEAPPPGFRILGSPDNGTYAEFIKVPAENLINKPPQFSWEEAAAFPLAALTAFRALFTRGKLKSGEVVVIPGVGAGTSTFLLQMARAIGARVIVSSSSDEKLDRARELGAYEGINYLKTDWVDEVRKLTGKPGADLVIDSVGQATWPGSIKVLRPGGRMVFFGATTGPDLEISIREVFFKQLTLLGTTMGNRHEFSLVLNFYNAHGLKPVIDRVFPLAETAAAHRYLEEGKQFGKVVLSIS